MKFQEQNIIGELVAEDYRTASVFHRNKIDFCCNGNRTIKEACQTKNLSVKEILSELEDVVQEQDKPMINFKSWSADLLADYIEKQHHTYVQKTIQAIMPFLHKLTKVHGNAHPELHEVEKLFQECAGELTMHMKKEEMVLFPFIRKMASAKKTKMQLLNIPFGTVENPIRMMMHEHEHEGERLRKIAELTNHYAIPKDACNTYSVTLSLLKEFEEDLHMHIHLENNILFPKALELEKSLSDA
jgi:regulator of cell morphogenesis and NO signaling